MAAPGAVSSRGVARAGVRRRRILLALGALVAAALAGPVPAAQAHAFLASSSPADGQVLTTAPSELRLAFSEAIVLGATRVDVVDGAGLHLAPTSLTVEANQGPGASAGTAEVPVELVVGLPVLAHGTYQVSWETLSADDLHHTTGVIVFGVAHPVTAAGLREPPPPPLEAGLRWLMFLGLSAALGGALAARLLDRAELLDRGGGGRIDGTRAGSVARLHSACGSIAAAGVAVILLAGQLTSSRAGAAELLVSQYGLRWGVREVGLLLIVAAATARPGSRAAARRSLLLASGGVLACVGTALLGHSGAGATTDLTRVIASAAHLGAAATWAGGVVVLAVVLFARGRRRRSGDGSVRDGSVRNVSARAVLQRFGPPAASCVAVMVVTGVYLSSEVVGSVDAALATIYGRTLLLKVALVGVAGALALVNTVRLHRRGARRWPRRTVVAEAVVVVGILALAAVLTSAQPAMEPQLVRASSAATVGFIDRRVDDLQETVAISPNRPGPNVISVDVFNTRRPAPGRVRAVQVAWTSADGVAMAPLSAAPLADGRWTVNATLGEPGVINVRVVVLREGLPETAAAYRWAVGGLPDLTRPAVVSTAPIGPLLKNVALGLLVLILGLGLGLGLALAVRRGVLRGRVPAGVRIEPPTGDGDAALERPAREPAVQ